MSGSTSSQLFHEEMLETLVDTLAWQVPRPVDELHVAALLESWGITDRLARDRYGYADVFALSAAILPALHDADLEPRARARVVPAVRTLVHGPLYLAPSLVVPALLTRGNHGQLLLGLVAATVVGWLWGTATSVVAYQLRGLRRERSAARGIRVMTLVGLLVALAVAAGLEGLGIVGPVTIAAAVTQVAFQLGACALVFYEREHLLALAVVPGVVLGTVYLVSGSPPGQVNRTLVAAVVSAALTLGLALLTATRAAAVPDDHNAGAHAGLLRAMGPPLAYASVSAALLLYTGVQFYPSGTDLAFAAAPLILGMGVVEWRAERFVESGARLLEQHEDLEPYRRRLWGVLLRELATVLAAVETLAVLLLAALAATGFLTARGALLAAAHVLLGGVFFLCFVLGRHAHFPWAVGAMAVVVLAYMVAVAELPAGLRPDGVVALFLGATTVLILLLLGAFAGSSRQVHSYLW